MDFCPKCGTVLRQEKKDEKIIMKCGKCGYNVDFELEKHKVQLYTLKTKKEIIVVGNKPEEGYKNDNIIFHKCPFCDHEKAYVKFQGVLWGDEDTIEIYECVKCGKSCREGILY